VKAPPRIDEQLLLEEFAALNLIGRSPPFLAALALVKKLARCDVPVLVEGETGTGKELAARAIHYLSARRDHSFVPVNCGAIPDNLIENELYGHARGAFTDAREAQPGLVSLADGGTLFLDEVDTLSAKAQTALLRFLQYQEYKPLGAKLVTKANVRVIAACNVDMQHAVEQGTFRQDLFFRLNIAKLVLPPLRERGADIAILTEHFVRHFRQRYNQPQKYLAPETMRWLLGQSWPGNVRELESFIHREFVLTDGDAVHLRPEFSAFRERRKNRPERRDRAQPGSLALREYKARAVADLEKDYLVTLLAETSGNVSLAARRAGKERRALGKLIKKYGINPRMRE
jgi:transcriptional regulator with GAF, ATPase, and Fis domain